MHRRQRACAFAVSSSPSSRDARYAASDQGLPTLNTAKAVAITCQVPSGRLGQRPRVSDAKVTRNALRPVDSLTGKHLRDKLSAVSLFPFIKTVAALFTAAFPVVLRPRRYVAGEALLILKFKRPCRYAHRSQQDFRHAI